LISYQSLLCARHAAQGFINHRTPRIYRDEGVLVAFGYVALRLILASEVARVDHQFAGELG